MANTAVTTNVTSATSACEQIMSAALSASAIGDLVKKMIREDQKKMRQEAAASSDNLDEEDDYCEEDKEALRNLRRQRQQPQEGEGEGGSPPSDVGGGVAPALDDLSDLKDKIRTLQVFY